ncbi:MAG: acyl-CoA desaturase [Pseudomonadota bacterium]
MVIDPVKTLWISTMITGGLVGAVFFASWSALAVFLILSAVTLCAGHSVGMHRLLIHRSFTAPLWVERTLVYLGTLVGMAGPFGMIRAHDMRDWHQRQTECPPHPSHGAGFVRDAFWQLCCLFRLDSPPEFRIEPAIRNDRFYRFLDATWMAQQLPVAAILFFLGGWGWLLFGVCLRVSVSLVGHWAVGHVAHKRGHQGWSVEGLPVQGYNLPRLGFLTFGESFHGNHHAFPHSARLGVEPGQSDPGYVFIRSLEIVGLASDIIEPMSKPAREGLVRSDPLIDASGISKPNRNRIQFAQYVHTPASPRV